ncbi:MAG: polysaccharide deacetylase family protein [Planctomycetes bacterium]|nr:polysaccharide deacetylase family protein [Planctomycetota bacterium]
MRGAAVAVERDPRVAYALGVLGVRVLDDPSEIPEDAILVAYTGEPLPSRAAATLRIVPSGFFGGTYGTEASLPTRPFRTVDGLPLLFGEPEIERSGRVLSVRADIIASAYFLLTRYEEMVRPDVRDLHGRFPGQQSIAFRGGMIERPLVDEYAALLRGWLESCGASCPAPDPRLRLFVTHDVDHIDFCRPWWSRLKADVKRLLGGGAKPARRPRPSSREGVLEESFERLEHLDRTRTMPPIYFFLGSAPADVNGNYDVLSKPVRRLLRRLIEGGAAIGLHLSYEAGKDIGAIAEEKRNLEDAAGIPIRRNRHHYLRWQEIEDGYALAAAGIDWDSTLAYADVAGFRLGTARPIPLFDPKACRPMGIEEHPLIVMDRTLHKTIYMNLGYEGALEKLRTLVRNAARLGGEFVVLWHNNEFTADANTYLGQLYEDMLSFEEFAREDG